MAARTYDQFCPIAGALDVLGERWTLLIMRELLGGPRRYADLREALPGIATNLLSERLRMLVAEGLVEQVEVPPPVARTMYRLTDESWTHVLPIARALVGFGVRRLPPTPAAVPPLTGFLAVVHSFDAARARGVEEDYRLVIDDRAFDVGVHDGLLLGSRGEPAAELHGRARALLEYRLGRRGAARRPAQPFEITGAARPVARFRSLFALPDPAIT